MSLEFNTNFNLGYRSINICHEYFSVVDPLPTMSIFYARMNINIDTYFIMNYSLPIQVINIVI